jgi:cytoskeletal protein CcmA (bactofilin family)
MAIMWGKDEKTVPAPALKPVEEPRLPSPPAPPATKGDARPMANIGKSLVLKAQITGEEDVYVDGQLEGSIELKNNNLTVGINGRVNANVIARNVFVEGNLTGNVVATEKVEIRKTGSLQGDLTTGGVTIEDGAYFKGSIDIARPK